MLFGGSRIQILNTALFNRPSSTIRFPARSAREDLDHDLVEVLVRRSYGDLGEILQAVLTVSWKRSFLEDLVDTLVTSFKGPLHENLGSDLW